MRELSVVAIQQGNPKEGIKHKFKSVDSGYRDLAIFSSTIRLFVKRL